MKPELSPEEEMLVEHAKKGVIDYNRKRHKNGGVDTLYSFVMTESGAIYDGACFEPNIAQATICGERHAIANMVLGESYSAKIKHVIVADPVPEVQEHSTPPCGTCRHIIWQFGKPDTSVLCLQYIQTDDGWIFPKLEKFIMSELYPHPYEPKEDLWH